MTGQCSIPDLKNVAFLPDPSCSLLAPRHPDYDPDEKMGDKAFTKKHIEQVAERYGLGLDEGESNNEGEDCDIDDGSQGSIDLKAESPEDSED